MAANQNNEAANERRARKANITSSELAVLIEQVDENDNVLKSKFTDSMTNAKKNEIWTEITKDDLIIYTIYSRYPFSVVKYNKEYNKESMFNNTCKSQFCSSMDSCENIFFPQLRK